MSGNLSICLIILCVSGVSHGVSTKVDFGEDESSVVVANSSKEDDDVEVKHTIVLSTKLKNNNRRGLHTSDDASGFILNNKNVNKEDSGEVPVVKAYKSVETTQIRTPDTRLKSTEFPVLIPMNRNSRDEFDFYPNTAFNPSQWKPSTLYNNINQWNQEPGSFNYNTRRNRPGYVKNHRKLPDDGVREFYCRKCRELTGNKGCIQQRSNPWSYESTTPKLKIDGKIAKLV